MYNYIINPTTLQKISIFSKEGKKLLKTYTNNFIGGAKYGTIGYIPGLLEKMSHNLGNEDIKNLVVSKKKSSK